MVQEQVCSRISVGFAMYHARVASGEVDFKALYFFMFKHTTIFRFLLPSSHLITNSLMPILHFLLLRNGMRAVAPLDIPHFISRDFEQKALT